MTARVAPVPPPGRPGDTVMVDGHPMVVLRLLPHLRGLRRTFLVSQGPLEGRRARWGCPGARRRADSGPLPGHRRAHLPSGGVPLLPVRGRWPLCPPRGQNCQPPAAFETGPLSAAAVSRTWTARVIAAWRIVAGAATAWTGRARRPRRRRGAGEHILMHRLLHHDCAGGWTWRVRGAQVPAARTTDVCLVIDPAADSHYCPDCLLGAVPLWDATAGNHPRVAKCRDCGSVFMLVFVHRRRAARAAMI